MEPERPDIDALEVRLLLEAINARYGYDLRGYSPKSIGRRLRAALAKSGLRHLGDLQHQLLIDPIFFAGVLEELTIRVSDMFRDPGFYRTLRTHVVPLLRTYPFLNIWHSGCASGEEAYSCAIVLSEEGLLDRTQIYATDLSVRAVDQAKQGVYSADKLPLFTDNYEKAGGTSTFASYYTSAYNQVALKDLLRRKILFFQHDLVSDQVFGEMNVIFCRNVLIYFGAELKERVMDKLTQSLCPGGFLCLGSSETIARSNKMFADFVPERQIYRYQGS